MIRDPIEDMARRLCRQDGRDPDEVNWMGDPTVPYGTTSWPRWHEYTEDARAALEEGEKDNG